MQEMATHSSILAWEIPWTEEPDGLQSTGLQRVRQDLATDTKNNGGIPKTATRNYAAEKCTVCGGTKSGGGRVSQEALENMNALWAKNSHD